MEFCLAPSQTASAERLVRAFGSIVERLFIRPHYCNDKGGCTAFPSGNTDFFDENSGFSRCRFLASYLKANNPTLDEILLATECEMEKPDPGGRFFIPDLITHSPPERFEFYEVKANSPSGIAEGQKKVLFFESLCGTHKLPYGAGTLYSPDRRVLIWDGTWSGKPFKANLHFFRFEPGLLVYEICVETKPEFLTEAAAKLLVQFLVAAIIYLLVTGGPVLVPAGVVVLALTGAVGSGGRNVPQDVRFVQRLLNDWRHRNGRSLISVDGAIGSETISAITDFQTVVTGVVDGRVDPTGAAIQQLETLHLLAVTTQVAPDWIAITPELLLMANDLAEEVGLTVPERDAAIEVTAREYLQEVHNS